MGAAYTSFEDIPLFHYDLIMADPPWSYENWSEGGNHKNAKAKYDCMSFEDICALPVGHLAKQTCALWLWATNPMLDQAIEVLKAWGFQFKTAGSWEKTTKHGCQSFGTGYILRSSNEPYLIGVNGSPSFANNVRSSFPGLAREHSQKPEEGYAHAERLAPKAFTRLELFSRRTRPGWDAFGDEVGKFDPIQETAAC